MSISFSITYIDSCQQLDIANEEYRLTEDVSSTSTCFSMTAPGITLDCEGHSITGTIQVDSDGVYSNQDRTKVRNCEISNWYNGLYFLDVDDGEITNNIANSNNFVG
ncbi:MAG: hypothetical protein ABIH83_04185, partial [Candidatus Micrarchaeota archaeon]